MNPAAESDIPVSMEPSTTGADRTLKPLDDQPPIAEFSIVSDPASPRVEEVNNAQDIPSDVYVPGRINNTASGNLSERILAVKSMEIPTDSMCSMFLHLAPSENAADDKPSDAQKLMLSFMLEEPDDDAVADDAELKQLLQFPLIHLLEDSREETTSTEEKKDTLERSTTIPLNSTEAALFQPIDCDSDLDTDAADEESDIEPDEILVTFKHLRLNVPDYSVLIRRIDKDIDHVLDRSLVQLFSPLDNDCTQRLKTPRLWTIPVESPGDVQEHPAKDSVSELRPNHDDDAGLRSLFQAGLGRSMTNNAAHEPVQASKLIEDLHLEDSATTNTAYKEPTAMIKESHELSTVEKARTALLAAISDLETSCTGDAIKDLDPSALRTLVRSLALEGPSEELRRVIKLHLLSVCKFLVHDPKLALEYINYCARNEQYQLGLDPYAAEFFSSLRKEFQSLVDEVQVKEQQGASQNLETEQARAIRTSVLVDSNRLCGDATFRKICNYLSDNLNVQCLERNLGEQVSIELDDNSACLVMSIPLEPQRANPSSPQAMTAWAAKAAKWLVMESSRYSNVYIVIVLDSVSAPDVATRTAIRNLTSTLVMLAPPAPNTQIRLGFDISTAALLIRDAIDSCAKGDTEWYRQRDIFPETLQEEQEQQIQLLRQFPGMTHGRAERVALTESVSEFFIRCFSMSTDGEMSSFASILGAYLLPEIVPSVHPMHQHPSMQHEVESGQAMGFTSPHSMHYHPPMHYESEPGAARSMPYLHPVQHEHPRTEGKQELSSKERYVVPIVLDAEQKTSPTTPTPRTRRKRRLTLQRDSSGSNQTRLAWSYIE